MATLFWDEIVERANQHNKTVICQIEMNSSSRDRYFKLKCNICGHEEKTSLSRFSKCNKCNKKINTEIFILKAKKLNGDKFNYDLVEYVNSYLKVKIKCNTCHKIFLQKPHSHLSGRKCMICFHNKYRSNTEEFILKAKKIHEDKYNYDLVEYVNSVFKVKIKCNICKIIFMQSPLSHLSGHGCISCGNNLNRSNTDEFIIKSRKVHGDLYNYDLVEYINNATKVRIICNMCNNEFLQRPDHHYIDRHGCSVCIQSNGENKVKFILDNLKKEFIYQKVFDDLKDIRHLKFDFYLTLLNLLIEYDGEGHYKPIYGKTPEEKQKNFEDCQRRDKIKNEWAKANNIPLLRIPYLDFHRIPELIEEFILQHTNKKEIKQLSLEM
jgi:hypothetical protein